MKDLTTHYCNDSSTLTILANNPFVRNFIMMFAFIVTLGPIAFVISGIVNFDIALILIGTTLSYLIPVAAWKIASRKKEFQIRFDKSGIQVSNKVYKFSEIKSFGISDGGGAPNDPASMPIPRNSVTNGTCIYLDCGGQHIPITVGLELQNAREALKQFTRLYEQHAP